MIDSGNGSPIPVIVRASNIVKANQAVYLLFNVGPEGWDPEEEDHRPCPQDHGDEEFLVGPESPDDPALHGS